MKKQINYSNINTLKNYALWYYLKYYPSIGKLTKKLLEKTQDKPLINKVLNELKSEFKEEYLLEIKIQELLDKGKTEKFIINKLVLKDFKKDDIIKTIKSQNLENNFKSYSYIKQKIEQSLDKKSLNNIKYNLLKSGFNKVIIEQIIEENLLSNSDEKIKSEITKIQKNSLSKEKLIQKMLSKGYKYNEFKNLIK